MYDVRSDEFKYHYQKSKYKVKQWEDQFKTENGRIPSKTDIKAASAKVKYYYKIYWKLKTKLLEETILGDSSEPDPHKELQRSKSDGVLKEHTNIIDEKCTTSNGKPSQAAIAGTNMKENDTQSNVDLFKTEVKLWEPKLNRTKSTPVDANKFDNILTPKVAQKLFEGFKFKKRNPRKPLKKKVDSTEVSNTSTVRKSNDAPSAQKLEKLQSNVSLTSIPSFNSTDSFPVSDFSPCPDDLPGADEQCSVETYCSPKIKALIMSKAELSPLLTKSDTYRVVSEGSAIHSQPVSLVQKLTEAPEMKRNVQSVRKLDVGWIDRCTDAPQPASLIEQKLSFDSGFESLLESSEGDSREDIKEPEKNVVEEEDDDDEDDVIAGSDNELDDSSRISFLPVKRKSEDTPVNKQIIKLNLPILSRSPEASSDGPTNKKMKLDPYQFPEDKTEAKKARLEKKVKQGTLNENYVRINIKKKVFVRGKKNFNISKHKKKQWKKLRKNMEEGEDGHGIVLCYKCGDAGHFARYCHKRMDQVLPNDAAPVGGDGGVAGEDEEEESTLPTLEEAEAMAKEKANNKKKPSLVPVITEIEMEIEEPCRGVEPLFEVKEDGNVVDTPKEVFDALRKFGHSQFRPGQEEAIMRILSGLSTLVTVATGGGKSLCYQLPAYLYAKRSACLTLVISPLVSLMEDQVSGSSSFFKLGCLHTNQTRKQREAVLEDAKNGKLYALLVSPEAVVAGDSSSGLCNTLKSLPPIAFACIDEVHCVSQWSHNFRPSYLMLSRVLKEKLGVKTILGLTATATKSTIESITKELGISGVIKDIPLPDNLCLSISQDEHKDRALLELLKGPRFKDANAILIYCTRRDECERLATLIRTIHNDVENTTANSRKRLSWNAEAYHAGMSSARRKQVQRAFMKGNVRIVVATIAFGMGINKQDIRGVIHYNMPRDFESYVQEVGRAGRDGMPAQCHLFLDRNGRDLNELRRHIHSSSVDRHVLRKLLQRVFVECKCREEGKQCSGHEVAFDCNDTVKTLDIPEENIHTLLCYLELHPDRLIKVLTPGFVNCKIQSYRGVKPLSVAAKKCPPLAVACALDSDALKSGGSGSITFNAIHLSNTISWDSGSVKNQLKSVEWTQTSDGRWKKTGIVVEFFDLGFRVVSRGDMIATELDEALNYLIQRVEGQEKRSTDQLVIIHSALTHFASPSCGECLSDYDKEKSDSLKNVIREYFETERLPCDVPVKELRVNDFDEEEVAEDVRALVWNYRDNSFNGRTVARIMHGIQSPNYPASIWYKCRHWRQHMDKDFNKICRIATREILRLK